MMDLTKIEKPFGLLDKETQDALKAHGGPYECFEGSIWRELSRPMWEPCTTYRVKPQPVRGEAVFTGSLLAHYSLLWGRGYEQEEGPARVTFTTADGKLIPGTYTGPDGATITVEAL